MLLATCRASILRAASTSSSWATREGGGRKGGVTHGVGAGQGGKEGLELYWPHSNTKPEGGKCTYTVHTHSYTFYCECCEYGEIDPSFHKGFITCMYF